MTMKRNFTRRLVGAAVLGSMLVAPLVLSAQREGRRGHRGNRGPGAILRELDLTEDQRQQMRALRQDGDSTGAMKRLMEARRALNEAVESGAQDEGAIRQLAYEVGTAEGDAAIERARLHSQMMSILTPEQQEKYKTLVAEQTQEMEERRQRFEERRNERRNR